jgi:hypothetical protein
MNARQQSIVRLLVDALAEASVSYVHARRVAGIEPDHAALARFNLAVMRGRSLMAEFLHEPLQAINDAGEP